jgi:hypothetical protein
LRKSLSPSIKSSRMILQHAALQVRVNRSIFRVENLERSPPKLEINTIRKGYPAEEQPNQHPIYKREYDLLQLYLRIGQLEGS